MYARQEIEYDASGCHAKRHIVGQRVEFLTNGRRHAEQPSTHAVEKIEHCTYDDPEQCQRSISPQCKHCGHASGYQIATGDDVGNVLLHGIRAMTVWSPVVD